jgi:L-arabonate dehydrase
MARISDARMSGTAFGTAVLHIAPESAAGGPLAVVRNGDVVELGIVAHKLQLAVSESAERQTKAVETEQNRPASGYARLYPEHVVQGDRGADFDFLAGCRGADIPAESP